MWVLPRNLFFEASASFNSESTPLDVSKVAGKAHRDIETPQERGRSLEKRVTIEFEPVHSADS
jgi:hypothetical protein